MVRINENYLKLEGNYLFSEIAQRVDRFAAMHPEKEILRLGIGDVTRPLVPAVLEALHQAVDEMGDAKTFRGYGPAEGYAFLRDLIAEQDYQARGYEIAADEIFLSDGAKSDAGNLQELFARDCRIAVCDPVYPVYVDTNVMAGRTGTYQRAETSQTGRWSRVIDLPCTQEHGFLPELPRQTPDLIYLCAPNNPTGAVFSKEQLQCWVDYANRVGAVIFFDAAYEAYITDPQIPHSIFACEGARTCAIELRSFSKNAGFTGLRLGAAVIPKELKCEGQSLHTLWSRRQASRYNGTSYVIQRGGAAVYREEGRAQIREQVVSYQKNAKVIYEGLKRAGYQVYGGINAPYIWMKTPRGMTSWAYFSKLLEEAGVVGTPGAGFGSCGEGYMRFSAFGSYENALEAVERICKM